MSVVLLLSAASGLAITLALILFRDHDKRKPVPFGPYLAAAGWISLLWGEVILSRYLGAAGLN